MKNLIKIVLAATMFATVVACQKKNKGGGGEASTPAPAVPSAPNNSCAGLYYNYQNNKWYDHNGTEVSCQYGNYVDFRNVYPYYNYDSYAGYEYGCEGWSEIHNVTSYPMNIGNGHLVCVRSSYYRRVFGSSYGYSRHHYNDYDGYYTCRYGDDCYSSSRCRSASAGIGLGFFWLGAGVGICY